MAEGGSSAVDLKAQLTKISNLMKQPLKKGEVRYLIDNRWFKQWKKYVGFDTWDTVGAGEQSAHPGPIDNGPLFKDEENGGEIREHLIDELDYMLLPEEAWTKLVSWYGLNEGQEPIVRNVVENGLYVKLYQVEVYLVELKLCENSNLDHCISKKFSKMDTIETVEKEMRQLFDIPDDRETRLWNRYTSYTYEQLSKKDSTIQDVGLYSGQVLVIEQKNEDGTWPRQAKCTNSALGFGNSSANSDNKQYGGASGVMSTRYGAMGGYGSYNYNYNAGNVVDVQPGLCGLSNLGNTCFMNSALQCMSNTPPITRYFLEDRYWDELNTENPLGMKGEIAKAYGELIKLMWSGKHSCTAPRNFKMQVGRFAPQFSGYQQQDSQELMAFLLDGLHEDLNRIKKKPYVELRDADGRPDQVVAQEAWLNYRKRNDSIIVDIFHGLLKSTLVCPECDKISVTFDPFCYLTLPLPIKKERQIEVFFVSMDPEKVTMQYKVTVPKAGTVRDLCSALGKLTNVSANNMIVTDVYNHKFHKIFQPGESLSSIMDRDCIFVYDVPVGSFDDPEIVILPVYLRQKRLWPGCSNDGRAGYCLFGHPLIIAVPRENCTYEILYRAVLKQMTRYVTEPSPEEQWWAKKDDAVNGEGLMSNWDMDNENESHLDDDNKEDEDVDEDADVHDSCDGQDVDGNRNHYLFSMHFVNSSGSADIEKVKDNWQNIKFSYRPYLAIDWHSRAKELFYKEKLAEILEQHESVSTYGRANQKRQVIQLKECLELFTATERLSAEDSWYCPACKKHQQATKKFDLWSLPQVLVLCFKRFSYSRYVRDKIDTLVEFPTKGLSMSPYIISQDSGLAIYDLIAVSNHYGGMGGGHYTAYAKNKDDNRWYYFDDSSVSPAKEEVVVSKAAYVLFYIRRDSREGTTVPANVREIPAALGTPDCQDNGFDNGSDEDCPMDTN